MPTLATYWCHAPLKNFGTSSCEMASRLAVRRATCPRSRKSRASARTAKGTAGSLWCNRSARTSRPGVMVQRCRDGLAEHRGHHQRLQARVGLGDERRASTRVPLGERDAERPGRRVSQRRDRVLLASTREGTAASVSGGGARLFTEPEVAQLRHLRLGHRGRLPRLPKALELPLCVGEVLRNRGSGHHDEQPGDEHRRTLVAPSRADRGLTCRCEGVERAR